MAGRFDADLVQESEGDVTLGGVRSEYLNTYEFRDGSVVKLSLYAKKVELIK
jgi:hypothetical protein